MEWKRCAGAAGALALLVCAGCLNDVSNIAPYSARIGTTYALNCDCTLWAPKGMGSEYTILPPLPGLSSKLTGTPLAEGTLLHVEAARRGDHNEDYLLVSLASPTEKGKTIHATVQPRYLEGWTESKKQQFTQ